MTRLLNFGKGTAVSREPELLLPEKIVQEAEALGCLEVKRSSWSRGCPYEAEITFGNSNGSRIHAKGIDMDFFTAIAKAVEEARALSNA